MAGKPSHYILMHKEIPVAELLLDGACGIIRSVGRVYEALHVPVGIPVKGGEIDRSALNAWWQGRAIPASRMGIRDALQEMKIPDTRLLAEKAMGLSLSDQYWIRPAESEISWKQVNFFDNPFSEDVGNLLFGKDVDMESISLVSPDNTSDGWLRKKWIIAGGKRCLLKGGSGAVRQEPYNEVLAGRICRRLGIPHVSYTLTTEEDYPYSLCEDFVTPDTELISAWYIMQTAKKPNHVSIYRHYLDCCRQLGISGAEAAVNQMIVLDYLIVNEDRHQNNFGVLRKADTLEYVGAAPIYDSGTSLWFDKPTAMIKADARVSCKPFKNTHEEQMKLVTDFDWLDISALSGIDEELREILRGSLFIDEARCGALCEGLKGRAKMLEAAAASSHKSILTDNVQFDVVTDSAYSGESDSQGQEPEWKEEK